MEERLELKPILKLMKSFEKRNNISITLLLCSDGSFGIEEFWENDMLFEGDLKQVNVFLEHTKYKLANDGRCLDPVEIEEQVYFQKDQEENPIDWIKGLNASGYAGCLSNGNIVDRREFPEAIAVQRSSVFGTIEPRPL